jgi:hypothetical protein
MTLLGKISKISVIFMLIMLAGCKTTYIPVETVRTETERVVDIQRDSIYVLDSVFVREAHDTVYITKWRTEYKEALHIDTLNIERIDTLIRIVEVEKRLTKVQQLKMDVGAGVMYAVPILIAVGLFILYRKLKK